MMLSWDVECYYVSWTIFALPITVKSGSPSRILCFK